MENKWPVPYLEHNLSVPSKVWTLECSEVLQSPLPFVDFQCAFEWVRPGPFHTLKLSSKSSLCQLKMPSLSQLQGLTRLHPGTWRHRSSHTYTGRVTLTEKGCPWTVTNGTNNSVWLIRRPPFVLFLLRVLQVTAGAVDSRQACLEGPSLLHVKGWVLRVHGKPAFGQLNWNAAWVHRPQQAQWLPNYLVHTLKSLAPKSLV